MLRGTARGKSQIMLHSFARPRLRSLQRWLEAGVDLVFPPLCAGCGTPGVEWCAECDGRLARILAPVCTRCGRPVGRGPVCPDCRRKALPLEARAYAEYSGPLVPALLQMKYRPNRRLGGVMSGWLMELVSREAWSVDLVTAVPLSSRRQAVRGYNQSDLIAHKLSDRLGIQFSSEALSRIRDTRSQVGLDPLARAINVRGAFSANKNLVEGRRILIVDDLFTTGATLAACHAALSSAGAQRAYGISVGRARANRPTK